MQNEDVTQRPVHDISFVEMSSGIQTNDENQVGERGRGRGKGILESNDSNLTN